MARMKDVLLDAAVAVTKALEVGATVEQILEQVDYISDRPQPPAESGFFPTHMPHVERR